jgi:hypothetical protein
MPEAGACDRTWPCNPPRRHPSERHLPGDLRNPRNPTADVDGTSASEIRNRSSGSSEKPIKSGWTGAKEGPEGYSERCVGEGECGGKAQCLLPYLLPAVPNSSGDELNGIREYDFAIKSPGRTPAQPRLWPEHDLNLGQRRVPVGPQACTSAIRASNAAIVTAASRRASRPTPVPSERSSSTVLIGRHRVHHLHGSRTRMCAWIRSAVARTRTSAPRRVPRSVDGWDRTSVRASSWWTTGGFKKVICKRNEVDAGTVLLSG